MKWTAGASWQPYPPRWPVKSPNKCVCDDDDDAQQEHIWQCFPRSCRSTDCMCVVVVIAIVIVSAASGCVGGAVETKTAVAAADNSMVVI